jgi:hypothetical protein
MDISLGTVEFTALPGISEAHRRRHSCRGHLHTMAHAGRPPATAVRWAATRYRLARSITPNPAAEQRMAKHRQELVDLEAVRPEDWPFQDWTCQRLLRLRFWLREVNPLDDLQYGYRF